MKQQSITTLPPSPEAERRSRMIKYTIAMSIRVLCIFAMLFAQGWWLVIFAAGAVFLPYIAVVLANVSTTRTSEVLRPGGIVPVGNPPTYEEAAQEAPTMEGHGAAAGDPSAADHPTTESASPRNDDERGAA